MIEKINENAYFIVDVDSYCTSVQAYDPLLANQSIVVGPHQEEIALPAKPEKKPQEETEDE